MVSKGSVDREVIGNNSDGIPATNENTLCVQTLERCLTEKIDREKGNFVDTVEDRIQNMILTTIDNFNTPRIKLAVRSMGASSERDAASTRQGQNLGKK